MSTIPELFGSLVFDDKVMRARLSSDVYHSLRDTINKGKKLEASGSPVMRFRPENSTMTWLSGAGVIKLSCFSAVMPVSGWNQWVKCVAPFSTAHSHMAAATALATDRSSFLPLLMVSRRL